MTNYLWDDHENQNWKIDSYLNVSEFTLFGSNDINISDGIGISDDFKYLYDVNNNATFFVAMTGSSTSDMKASWNNHKIACETSSDFNGSTARLPSAGEIINFCNEDENGLSGCNINFHSFFNENNLNVEGEDFWTNDLEENGVVTQFLLQILSFGGVPFTETELVENLGQLGLSFGMDIAELMESE